MNLYRFILLWLAFLNCVSMPCLAQTPVTPDTPPEQSQQYELTPEEKERLQRDAEEAAAGCAVCAGGFATILIVLVVIFVLNIALLIWVARDAKSRGMDSSILWMFLVMFTSVLGLLIYVFSRPQGALARCPSCGGKRLAASATCPHCHNP